MALLLTVLLFWGVFAGFGLLQHWGWGVDAAAMVHRFRHDRGDPQVSWVLWMALTNVLPTLLHVGLACAGLWSGWLLRDDVFASALRAKSKPGAPTGLLTAAGTAQPGRAPTTLSLQAPLQKPEAVKLMNWVYVDFWLAVLLPFCLLLAAWPAWQWLMLRALAWVL